MLIDDRSINIPKKAADDIRRPRIIVSRLS